MPTSVTAAGLRAVARDEQYIVDMCDDILGCAALRQHRFDFLRGDPGKNGHRRMLPVDAWYPALNLVIEYRERQHSEPVEYWDSRSTISGVGRGEQRRRYDQRRREVLAGRKIRLVEIDYSHFAHDRAKRLVRSALDHIILVRLLKVSA